jgi:hypothetical protein
MARLPGDAPHGVSSNTVGYSHSKTNSRISQNAVPRPPARMVAIAAA